MKTLKADASETISPKELSEILTNEEAEEQPMPPEARLDAFEKRLSILERKGKN